jgi:acyl-CoA thioesterase
MHIQELLNRTDRFAANAGCQITEVDTEHAVAEMIVRNEHLNGADVCQGGALFTLADLAIAALMNARGQLTVGISNSIMFVSSAKEGDHLHAEAVSVCDHHKIPSVEVRVTNQEGRLICHVTGIGYRKSMNIL